MPKPALPVRCVHLALSAATTMREYEVTTLRLTAAGAEPMRVAHLCNVCGVEVTQALERTLSKTPPA